jgi:peptide/nickel transport system substrate-binding protein
MNARSSRIIASIGAFVAVAAVIAGSATGGSTATPQVDRNGSLIIAGSVSATSLDPIRTASVGNYPWILPIYDRLTQIDAKKKLLPMLATDWKFSRNSLSLTMNLRRDAKFHDGTPADADAVKASIDRARTTAGSVWSVALAPIASITVISPSRVQFNLSTPSGDLPALLATPAGSVINPKALADGRNLGLSPGDDAGSGPLVVTSFTPGVSISYQRGAGKYWDPKADQLAKLTMLNISDDEARMNAFRSGQADMMQIKIPQLNEALSVAKDPSYRFVKQKLYGTQFSLFLRTNRSEFDKIGVRQALNYAIDRQAIAKGLLGGQCDVEPQPFSKGEIGYVPSLHNAYKYDPAKAKKYLAAAGLPNGFTFTMTTVTVSPQMEISQVVKDQLAKVGVTANIAPTPVANGTAQFNSGSVDSYLSALTGAPDPAVFLDQFFIGGSKMAYPAAPEIAQLAQQGRNRTKDGWTRYYRVIASKIMQRSLYVPICFAHSTWLTKKNVLNVETMPWMTSQVWDPRFLAVTR